MNAQQVVVFAKVLASASAATVFVQFTIRSIGLENALRNLLITAGIVPIGTFGIMSTGSVLSDSFYSSRMERHRAGRRLFTFSPYFQWPMNQQFSS